MMSILSASPPFIEFSCAFSEILNIYSPINNVPVILNSVAVPSIGLF
jgi:hypothetical protein